MSNKNISEISKNYSQALVDIAEESGTFDAIKHQFEDILTVVNSSSDLRLVMENSAISFEKKSAVLTEIFKDKIDDKMLNFLKLIVEKNRYSELQNIYESYVDISNSSSNKKRVDIVSSVELDENTKNKIIDTVQRKLGCEVIPGWSTDKSIIAGLVFKFDDYVVDTSVSAKLKSLSKGI